MKSGILKAEVKVMKTQENQGTKPIAIEIEKNEESLDNINKYLFINKENPKPQVSIQYLAFSILLKMSRCLKIKLSMRFSEILKYLTSTHTIWLKSRREVQGLKVQNISSSLSHLTLHILKV